MTEVAIGKAIRDDRARSAARALVAGLAIAALSLLGCAPSPPVLTTADMWEAMSLRDAPALMLGLSSDDPDVRSMAARGVRQVGPDAVPELLRVLREAQDPHSPGTAAIILADLGVKDAIPDIIAALPVLATSEQMVLDPDDHPYGSGTQYYNVLERTVTPLVSFEDHPAIRMLTDTYGQFITVHSASLYHARYRFLDSGEIDDIEILIVDYTLQAGAFALTKLTGLNLGTDPATWKSWWEESAPVPPQ